MNWFAVNGDKVLNTCTVVLAFLSTQSQLFGPSLSSVPAWLTAGSAVATLIHQVWFPNSPNGGSPK